MGSNKIGKYFLVISLFYLIILTIVLELFADRIELLSGVIKVMSILFLLLIFFIGIALIYYNSAYEKRRKVIILVTLVSIILFLIAFISKLFALPGVSIEGILSCFLFSFSALPLIIKSRYEDRKKLLNNKVLVLNYVDLFSVILLTMGFLFMFMHWPGATIMIIIGVLMLFSTLIGWNISFKREVKLRSIIEERLKLSLNEIEEKNKEITDSINYAKRIQDAIFPSFDFIKKNIPNSFIYYQPKDIVAGDFYWAEKIGDIFLIAAADCTGHGVPGALVSVVCCNALNRSVNEFKLTDPGLILDKTRELVIESFSKNGENINDGMDISLVSIMGNKIKWAGANNPLWYFQDNELKELKANKQSIGKTDQSKPFTTHILDLNSNDSLYLFTDGLADQFGGIKGKKFKYKQIEELLISSNKLELSNQYQILNSALMNWKGNLEQVDDICVIGIRL
jgi:serine phosphatase RsbU (regulator of sigma subunit)